MLSLAEKEREACEDKLPFKVDGVTWDAGVTWDTPLPYGEEDGLQSQT